MRNSWPMKNKQILPALLVLLLAACNKDKFKTEPQVTIKSISPSTATDGNVISIRGNFTDDEGDLDSALIVYKWYNGAVVVKPGIGDTLRYTLENLNLPEKTRQADILIEFELGTFNNPDLAKLPSVTRDTTATLGLILKDKKGQRSNYSESEKIRLLD